MFGINEARRRKIVAEENAFDYANRITKPTPKQNIYSGGFLSLGELKEEVRNYKETKEEKRIVQKAETKIKKEKQERRKERLEPYEKALGNVFSYRPKNVSRLKTRVANGIYQSPFKR